MAHYPNKYDGWWIIKNIGLMHVTEVIITFGSDYQLKTADFA
jgi:hypothetical protein